jgi:hypothetical protein
MHKMTTQFKPPTKRRNALTPKFFYPSGIRTRDLLFWRRTRWPQCHAARAKADTVNKVRRKSFSRPSQPRYTSDIRVRTQVPLFLWSLPMLSPTFQLTMHRKLRCVATYDASQLTTRRNWRRIATYDASQLTMRLNLRCVSTYDASQLTMHRNLRCVSTYDASQLMMHRNLRCIATYDASQLTMRLNLWCVATYDASQLTMHRNLRCVSTYDVHSHWRTIQLRAANESPRQQPVWPGANPTTFVFTATTPALQQARAFLKVE